jgi:hypothetical protein
MTKDDLKQIGELLDSKLEEKLGKAVSEIASMVNVAFTEFEEKTTQQFDKIIDRIDGMEQRLDKIDEELSHKPALHEINAWADGNLIPFQRDVEKLKYLHIKELKDIPDNLTISSALIDEGLN